ncbi:hypothetical protein [Brevundimonas sp.]|uniref:hypothetical protein n=1 Tax=Brevundimonas sp. TaxID=1871086 RepID=UPI001D55372C|nr:hypothetical protein [Brevundimonas sp.]MBL0947484.1 hypothetical protein [Brevundimonas sp.]
MRHVMFAALVALLIAGCKGDGAATGAPGGGTHRAILDEAWCNREGLTPALRQTVFLVDERALVPGKGAAFRTANPKLFEAMNTLASPSQGQASGIMAPRERLTVYVMPSDGGAPRLIYSGCAPGFSAGELADAQSNRSRVGDFVGGSLAGELESATEAYNRRFILSIARMGDIAAPPPVRAGDFARSSLLSSLSAVRQLARDGAGVARYFVFTDLATFPDMSDSTAAREAGFELARESRLFLGGADVVLIGSQGSGTAGSRDFATAFFLGSQSDLLGWGSGALGSLPAAPVAVQTYSGELRYPGMRYPMRLIIGRDAQNRLVNSWLFVTSDAEWATPVGGSLRCSGDVCELLSDNSGLGQRWSLNTDAKPEFDAELPLSGMRAITAEIAPDHARGEIWDPDVDGFLDAPTVKSLPFELNPF